MALLSFDAAAQQSALSPVQALVGAPGPSFLSASFSVAATNLEQPLLDMIAAKEKKAAETLLSLLRSQRHAAEAAEQALISGWAAWTESLSAPGLPAKGSADPLSGFARAAHAAMLSSLRRAESAALAEARRFLAKAAVAKNFNVSAIRLLGDFERGLELPPSLLAGGTALAALKNEHLKNLLAAALSGRPRLYIEALSLALPENGRVELNAAAEAFRAALFELPELKPSKSATTNADADPRQAKAGDDTHIASLKAMLSAASALSAEAGEPARMLGLYYTCADVYGFLSLLLLARPETERAFLLAGGIIPRHAYGLLDSAFSYTTWPKPELSGEDRQSASLLYSAWLSASLRNDSLEAGRFALLSAAPALNELLTTRVAAAHRAALELSFERHWLEARNALSLDLRADTLLWLRSIGQRPAPNTLSLEARITRWPGLPFTAGIELVLKAEGRDYAVPYTAISASLRASLSSVFGPAMPAFVYLEARGEASESFAGPTEHSDLALQALGEDLSTRYALGMAYALEAWMEQNLRQSSHLRTLARFYARTAQAARLASEPWYAALAPHTQQGGRP